MSRPCAAGARRCLCPFGTTKPLPRGKRERAAVRSLRIRPEHEEELVVRVVM